MATEKHVAGSGAGLTWTDAFSTATLNSAADNQQIISDLVIDNSTALDMYADVSFHFGSAAYTTNAKISILIYPLNKDATTYGNGQGTAAITATEPDPRYLAAPHVMCQGGTAVQDGVLRGVLLPPGKFKFMLVQQLGATAPASGNTCQYRTYNRSVA